MINRQRILNLLAGCQPGRSLPQAFYNDPEVYEFDVATILTRSWFMLGFTAELAGPGSYISVTIGPHPILAVRGRDGRIRAFHNTCRHRGAQICPEGSGSSPRIVCPYHRWTYDLDGRLMAATRMPATFEASSHGLIALRTEILSGCIYVALSDAAPDFEPFRAAAQPHLDTYRLADTKLAFESVLTEKANWKLVMENARECYHCLTGHPDLKISFPMVFEGGLTPVGSDPAVFENLLRSRGLSADTQAGSWWHVGRYPLNPGIETVSMDGRPVVSTPLMDTGGHPLGGFRWATDPNTFCHAFSDYVFMFSALPVGPEETRVISKWLVSSQAREGIDYDLEKLTTVWTKTNLQDRALAENNQRGVNGRGYRPGPYAPGAEELVIRFNDWYRATARDAANAL
ncbi:MAG: aromatic ring-hydroxylating dioxygenase subunit alpha [Proteobacteria bacterium]|nr:aromatic ring-hydroxylating dioxygenase subunit alpha [Pseudomonadota bacterium]